MKHFGQTSPATFLVSSWVETKSYLGWWGAIKYRVFQMKIVTNKLLLLTEKVPFSPYFGKVTTKVLIII